MIEAQEALTVGDFHAAVEHALGILLPDVEIAVSGQLLTCRRANAVVEVRPATWSSVEVLFSQPELVIQATAPLDAGSLNEAIADMVGFFCGAPLASLTVYVRRGQHRTRIVEREKRAELATHCSCLHAVNAHCLSGCQANYRDDFGTFTRCPCNRSSERAAEGHDGLKSSAALAAAIMNRRPSHV